MSSEDPVVRQLVAIADLLLGAAYADGSVGWPERSMIARVLAGFVHVDDLPEEVRDRVQSFDPSQLDIAQAVAELTVETSRDRRELLGLVSRIVDADAELVPDEVSYLRRVAAAIGASEEELADFLEPD